MFSNHFLKDDTMLISYKCKITIQNEYATFYIDKYSGFDYCIHGIEILKGARDYSQYDIEIIFSQNIFYFNRNMNGMQSVCKLHPNFCHSDVKIMKNAFIRTFLFDTVINQTAWEIPGSLYISTPSASF